jgi:hypothetical protein
MPAMRKPDETRADFAGKQDAVEVSGMFKAVPACRPEKRCRCASCD